VVQHFSTLTRTRVTDARFREPWLGLAGLAVLLEGLRGGRPVTDVDRLAARLGTTPEAIGDAIEPLVAAGLVVQSGGEPAGYLLARDPHELTLARVLAAYERPADELLASLPEPMRDNLEALIARLRENRETTLAGRNVAHLLG
jgi:DNA-binding IscR family transcriptional regulator